MFPNRDKKEGKTTGVEGELGDVAQFDSLYPSWWLSAPGWAFFGSWSKTSDSDLLQTAVLTSLEPIRLAAPRSSKSSKAVKVDGSRCAQVPREGVYDTELMRILSNLATES